MRLAIALALCLSVAAAGCGRAGPGSSDGVHFSIDNRLKAHTGYSVEFPQGGGMGENAPKGESEHVEPFPPGKVRIGCYESREDLDPDYGTLKIAEGESGYKSTQLECPSGMAVEDGVYAPGAEGKKGDPVDITRRRFSGKIEEGDVVEVAGYPKSKDQKSVRVVREGRWPCRRSTTTNETTGRGLHAGPDPAAVYTRDGEETIWPYIEDEPYTRFVEARSRADATLKELEAARDKASGLVDELDIRAEGISTNVKRNRVEIFATGKVRLQAAMRKMGTRLPEHVAVVEVEGPMAPA
jgi:hypothetical protein